MIASASEGWKTSGDAQNLRAAGQGAVWLCQLCQLEDHCPAFQQDDPSLPVAGLSDISVPTVSANGLRHGPRSQSAGFSW